MTALSFFCKPVCYFLIFCSSFCQAWGQLQVLGFHFKNPKQKQWKIPFRQHNNLIIIQVTINDSSDTLNFVLDTGVGYTLITDPTVREKFGLSCTRTIKIAGFGTDRLLNACIVKTHKMGVGKRVIAHNQYMVILDEDILDLSRYAGIRIHGLLGYELFSKFVIQIDYPQERLTLTRPEHFKPSKNSKTQVLPITIEDMKPYLETEASFQKIGDKMAKLKLLLDTGAGHSLSLDMGTHPDIVLPTKYLPAQLGMTLSGTVDGVIGRIKTLQIGNIYFENVITTFPDSTSIANRLQLGIVSRQGNIGCGILSRFQLTFDYAHEKLYIKPNRHLKEAFEFSTSGIELMATPPYYNEIKIGGVRPHSPADRVGLRKGDKITAVDDRVTNDLKLGEIYRLINQGAGKRVTLLVQLAEGNFQVIELLLENPL